ARGRSAGDSRSRASARSRSSSVASTGGRNGEPWKSASARRSASMGRLAFRGADCAGPASARSASVAVATTAHRFRTHPTVARRRHVLFPGAATDGGCLVRSAALASPGLRAQEEDMYVRLVEFSGADEAKHDQVVLSPSTSTKPRSSTWKERSPSNGFAGPPGRGYSWESPRGTVPAGRGLNPRLVSRVASAHEVVNATSPPRVVPALLVATSL